MAQYTPATPNAFDENLIPEDIVEQYFEEYIGGTPLSDFMGEDMSSIIYLRDVNTGDGSSVNIPFARDIDYENPTTGYDQLEGNEQDIVVQYDQVSIKPYRFADGLQAIRFVKTLTPVNIFDMLRPQLMRASKKSLVRQILDTICGLPSKGGIYTPSTNIPSYDRAIAAGTVTDINDTREHWSGSNINAMVAAYAGGATYDANGLSVDHIRKLKDYAISGGAFDLYEPEHKITPTEILTKNNFPMEKYVYLIDPLSKNSLVKDPQWSGLLYQGMTRGEYQPESISGARCLGEVEGVMIYECPELAKYRITSNGKKSAWNLFLGAQAFVLAWAERPVFDVEYKDYRFNVGMAVSEIRGQKALMYPSTQTPNGQVEHGILHSFVRIG